MKQLPENMIDYLIELWLRYNGLDSAEIRRGENEEKDKEVASLRI